MYVWCVLVAVGLAMITGLSARYRLTFPREERKSNTKKETNDGNDSWLTVITDLWTVSARDRLDRNDIIDS